MTDTHTAIVLAADFYRAASNAALFASTDDTLPSLVAAHLMAGEPGKLMVEATNRYVASRETLDLIDTASYDSDWSPSQITAHLAEAHDVPKPEGYDTRTADHADAEHKARHEAGADHEHTVRPMPVTDLDVVVDIKGLVKVAKMLKQLESGSYSVPPKIIIEYTDDDKHASFTLTDHDDPDQTLRANVAPGEYVKMGSLWPAGVADDATTAVSVAAKWLAVLAKVDTGDRNPSVDIQLNGYGKPFMATIGARFRAIVVPLKKAG